MSFTDDMAAFAAKVAYRERAIHNGVSDLAFSSIVEGSPVTGAPGQPVDTGNLKGSWQNVVEGPLTRVIMTNVEYAPIIEENIRGATLRSQVGGFHSVALTRVAWQRIVDFVTTQVAGNG